MRIKITKGYGWYENGVGQEYDVIRTQLVRGKKEYIVWEDGDNYNWVDEGDCEEIEE